jgi:hypothetical protein
MPGVFVIRWMAAAAALGMAAGGAALGATPEPEEHDAQFGCPDCDHGCAYAKRMMGRFGRGLPPTPQGVEQAVIAQDSLTDLLHYSLDIRIDPVAKSITGSNEMTIKSLTDGLSEFYFRLQDNYSIPTMAVNGSAVTWTRLDPVQVKANLAQVYNNGDVFTLRVEYNGLPLNNGFDSILFTTHSGSTIVSTLSETDFAHTWWPVKDDNRDKATADLKFTVPSTYSVASNGALQSTTPVGGGWSQWYWKTNYPTATYLFCFAMTNYVRFSGTYVHSTGSMPLEFFIYPESDTTGNRNAWLATAQMLATYKPLFGLYPFINEKYGIYQFPFGGGMEHQTMTGQGTFSESVTAHELGHQWWGDNVTCAFWNDIWLNEGFATYCEALWLENKPGSTGAPALHNAMNARRPTSVNGTVYKFEPLDTADLNTIFSTNFSYRKPAWVLHMLRHVVGDETFFEILAAYRGLFEGASATTDDFQAVAEAVYGQDLDWFFDQWIYSRGAPSYMRAWRGFQVNGQWYVELYITQTQSASYPIFKMPIDVVCTVGGSPVTKVVWNDAKTEHLVFPVNAEPTSVSVDPTPWILATSNGGTTFVQGPPKVVQTVPAPGTAAEPGDISQIDIYFTKDVNAVAGQFTLTGAQSGILPFTFSYNASQFRARITPTSGLVGDQYTVTVSQTLTDVFSGKSLDGEVVDPLNPASLPSGDGVPGGSLAVKFTVAPPSCLGDADGSGVVDFVDITAILVHWGEGGPLGDADGSGLVDFDDISSALTNWGANCN